MRLGQAELTEKGKRAGLGIGMFGAAGILGLFGFGCLLATAIVAWHTPYPTGWPP